jgi:hypothetical protein
MSHEVENYKEKEFGYNWVSSSKFVFYLSVLCILAFVIGGSYQLYKHSYKGKPDVEVQSSSEYTPQYK